MLLNLLPTRYRHYPDNYSSMQQQLSSATKWISCCGMSIYICLPDTVINKWRVVFKSILDFCMIDFFMMLQLSLTVRYVLTFRDGIAKSKTSSVTISLKRNKHYTDKIRLQILFNTEMNVVIDTTQNFRQQNQKVFFLWILLFVTHNTEFIQWQCQN